MSLMKTDKRCQIIAINSKLRLKFATARVCVYITVYDCKKEQYSLKLWISKHFRANRHTPILQASSANYQTLCTVFLLRVTHLMQYLRWNWMILETWRENGEKHDITASLQMSNNESHDIHHSTLGSNACLHFGTDKMVWHLHSTLL